MIDIPTLIPYQKEYSSAVNLSFDSGTRTNIMVMPPGTGKTMTFSDLGHKWKTQRNKHVMYGVHRVELVDQIAQTLNRFGIEPSIIGGKSSTPDFKNPIQVGMIQSLGKLGNWTPDYIVIDECHHSPANSYNKLWREYPKSKILGVTATPIRLDGKSFSDQYENMINLYPVSYFFKNGYLAKPKHYVCTSANNDFKIKDGDYDHVALAKEMRKDNRIVDVIEAYQKYTPGMRIIVFAVDVQHSKDLAERFNAAGIPAGHIDGEMPADERQRIVQMYRNGDIKALINYDIVTEGFDVPATEAVALTRRTLSLSFFVQSTYRALRPKSRTGDPGVGYILDCCSSWLDHGPAGIDYPWSLIPDLDEFQRAIKRKRIIKAATRDPKAKDDSRGYEEMKGIELNSLEQEMERLLIFESFLHQCIEKRSTDFTEAVGLYKARLELMGLEMTSLDHDYIAQTFSAMRIDYDEKAYSY